MTHLFCASDVKLGYPRSWIRPTKGNWFLYSEGLQGLFICLNLEYSRRLTLGTRYRLLRNMTRRWCTGNATGLSRAKSWVCVPGPPWAHWAHTCLLALQVRCNWGWIMARRACWGCFSTLSLRRNKQTFFFFLRAQHTKIPKAVFFCSDFIFKRAHTYA